MRRALLLLLLLAIALAAQTPAWLLAALAQDQSQGILALRNSTGTIWNGAADAFVRGRTAGEREIGLGRIAWKATGIDTAARALRVEVRQEPGAPRPLSIGVGAGHVRFAGSVRLPAALVARLPVLTGSIATGDVVIDTDSLAWTDGNPGGSARLAWSKAFLAPRDLPAGMALGDVTGSLALDGGVIALTLRNSGGDLEISGGASSRTGKVNLLLQPRPGAPGTLAPWLATHTMGRTPLGYSIDAGWPGR